MASRWPYRVALSAAVATGAVARVAALPASDLASRLPALLCGLALVIWLPRVVTRRLGEGPGLATAWLLALWPPLVTASRDSLSAAGSQLFASLAAVSFLRWWMCGSRVAAGLYPPLAALAVALAPSAVPFVLACWIFAVGDLGVRPRTSARPKPPQILGVGLASAAALALLLLPGAARLRDALPALHQESGEGARRASALGPPLLSIALGLAALVGLALLGRRERRIATFSAVLVALQAAMLALSAGGRGVATAEMAVALPTMLVWAAVALAEPWTRSRAATIAR